MIPDTIYKKGLIWVRTFSVKYSSTGFEQPAEAAKGGGGGRGVECPTVRLNVKGEE